ncbi:alpha-ketoglutarate-dependent dioxygenase AlkB [Lipingzhangella sp. LS1_29]|uniref:Alpha-ketoglutarate-dependent dioxygenase AlkB n=1 Tax=Lipingzhangella rawalii TaxID=2055835 RepID=A0ABU2H0Z5_9ACTN|nr:alpha-ketoglutarate-dependent dioxygenase AlkB [Lipingzhangella rawalii]MDS1268975.1 alpha-ketoglutarate-dependent dioxygenase AlkB [Lipingzhangella rawalii]
MLFEIPRIEIAPGAVHLPGWLDPGRQRRLVDTCRSWAQGPGGLHQHRTRGGVMSVRMTALGWYWRPYRYTSVLPDGQPVQPFPQELEQLARRALADAYGDTPPDGAHEAHYDVALVNFYDSTARMGMHQDRDERSDAPVISVSLGDSCVFRFGNTETRSRPYTDIELGSGDLFVFGGPTRMAHHGVVRIHPNTADPRCGLAEGRLNITIRATGFDTDT